MRRSNRPALFHLAYLAEALVLAQWVVEQDVRHIHSHFGDQWRGSRDAVSSPDRHPLQLHCPWPGRVRQAGISGTAGKSKARGLCLCREFLHRQSDLPLDSAAGLAEDQAGAMRTGCGFPDPAPIEHRFQDPARERGTSERAEGAARSPQRSRRSGAGGRAVQDDDRRRWTAAAGNRAQNPRAWAGGSRRADGLADQFRRCAPGCGGRGH